MRGEMGCRLWLGFAAAAVLVPSVAFAQAAPAPAFAPGVRVQEVELNTQIIYDSNVTGADGSLAAARGLRVSDEIFEPSVHFELARPIGRETVYVAGDAGYDFHARNSRLNRENIDIRPGVEGRIGPCTTQVDGEYSRAQSNVYQLANSGGVGIPFQERNLLQVEEIGGSASCGRGIGLGPSVSASEVWTQNSSPVQRYVDAQTFSGSAGLTYQRPVLGSVRLFGAYSHTDYPNRRGLIGFPGAAISTGYETYSTGVSYTRSIGTRLVGSASLSYTKLSQIGSASPGFSGLTYSAALTYRLSTRLSATGTFSRATVPSNRLNSTYGIEELYSGEVLYTLSQRLSFGAGASASHEAFNGVPYPAGFDLTDQKIYTAFADATLRLTRRLSLSLDARQIKRDANYPGLSYPETRVGLTARATF
jgi:hypothetical protein